MRINGSSTALNGTIVAALMAQLLTGAGCGGWDCEVLCAERIAVCDRIDACDPDHCDQPDVACIRCDEDVTDLDDCVEACAEVPGDLSGAAWGALEIVVADLDDAGC